MKLVIVFLLLHHHHHHHFYYFWLLQRTHEHFDETELRRNRISKGFLLQSQSYEVFKNVGKWKAFPNYQWNSHEESSWINGVRTISWGIFFSKFWICTANVYGDQNLKWILPGKMFKLNVWKKLKSIKNCLQSNTFTFMKKLFYKK